MVNAVAERVQERDVPPGKEIFEISPDSLGRRWYQVNCWGCDSACILSLDRAALKGEQFCLRCRVLPEPVAQCGQMSANLWALGIDHEPCDRQVGHDGLCYFEAL